MIAERVRAAAAFVIVLAVGVYAHDAAADDGQAAAELVRQLDADVAHRALVADAVTRARDAIEQATRFLALHDVPRMQEAEGLALEWAQAGAELVRAAGAEEHAADVRRKATEAGAQVERTRALVEEGVARVGRLQAELAASSAGTAPAKGSGPPKAPPAPAPSKGPPRP